MIFVYVKIKIFINEQQFYFYKLYCFNYTNIYDQYLSIFIFNVLKFNVY